MKLKPEFFKKIILNNKVLKGLFIFIHILKKEG